MGGEAVGVNEKAVPNLEVFGFVMGSKPESPEFAPGGRLEIDRGRFAKSAYEPGGVEMTYPVRDGIFNYKHPAPAFCSWTWVDVNAHYTPRSRRADVLVVQEYFYCKAGDLPEPTARARMNELAEAAKALSPDIDASASFQKLTNQYLVTTRIEYKPLRAIGAEESRQ